MGMFTRKMSVIDNIEAQGFDPLKETYGERMKDMVPEKGEDLTEEEKGEMKGAAGLSDYGATDYQAIPVQAKPVGGKDYDSYYVIGDTFTSGTGTQKTMENLQKSSLQGKVREEDIQEVELVDGTRSYATKEKIGALDEVGAYAGYFEAWDPVRQKGTVTYSDKIKNLIKPTYQVSDATKRAAQQNLLKAKQQKE